MAKICKKCKLEKELSEFPKCSSGSKDGTRNECKVCYNNRLGFWHEKDGYKHQYNYIKKTNGKCQSNYDKTEKGKISHRKTMLKARYNLTLDQYNSMVIVQGNRCKICGQTFDKTPNIDHDHITSKIRGLLCSKCNTLLGMSKDSITILNNAIKYLEENE